MTLAERILWAWAEERSGQDPRQKCLSSHQVIFPSRRMAYIEATTSSSKSGPLTLCFAASLKILFLRGFG